jgi:hypothetical protein
MAFLNFSCMVKITTENFAAISAFTPVAALIVQLAAVAFGLIPHYTLDTTGGDLPRQHLSSRNFATAKYPGPRSTMFHSVNSGQRSHDCGLLASINSSFHLRCQRSMPSRAGWLR